MAEWQRPLWAQSGARVVRNGNAPFEPEGDVPAGTVGFLIVGEFNPMIQEHELIINVPDHEGRPLVYMKATLLEEWGSIDVEGPPLGPDIPTWIQIGALVECHSDCTAKRFCTIPAGVMAQVAQVYSMTDALGGIHNQVTLTVEGDIWILELELFEACWRRYTLRGPDPEPVTAKTAHERLLED